MLEFVERETTGCCVEALQEILGSFCFSLGHCRVNRKLSKIVGSENIFAPPLTKRLYDRQMAFNARIV
jgi:hypothetical protein